MLTPICNTFNADDDGDDDDDDDDEDEAAAHSIVDEYLESLLAEDYDEQQEQQQQQEEEDEEEDFGMDDIISEYMDLYEQMLDGDKDIDDEQYMAYMSQLQSALEDMDEYKGAVDMDEYNGAVDDMDNYGEDETVGNNYYDDDEYDDEYDYDASGILPNDHFNKRYSKHMRDLDEYMHRPGDNTPLHSQYDESAILSDDQEIQQLLHNAQKLLHNKRSTDRHAAASDMDIDALITDYSDLYASEDVTDNANADYSDLYYDDDSDSDNANANADYSDLYELLDADSEYASAEYSDLYYDDEQDIVSGNAYAYAQDDDSDLYDDDDGGNANDEWSNANELLSDFYEHAQEQEQEQEQADEQYADAYGQQDYAYVDEFVDDSEYNDMFGEYYDDEQSSREYADAFDDEDDEDDAYLSRERMVNNIPNNAWVWQLLILSFTLGVCSCLCYYATKISPSSGKYDFFHRGRARYSKVYAESGHSAFDHDSIEQSDIEIS